jgi:hypothetical protein
MTTDRVARLALRARTLCARWMHAPWMPTRWIQPRLILQAFAAPAVIALCLSPVIAHGQFEERGLLRWATPWLGSRNTAERGYLWYLADRFGRNGGPREFALAAHLRAMAGGRDVRVGGGLRLIDANTQRWLGDAERMGKDDPVVQALLLHRFSDGDPTYRRQDAIRRWRENDTDNLAPLLVIGPADEVLPIDELLASARSTARADFYFDDIARPLVNAVQEDPPSAASRRAMPDGTADAPEALGVQLGMTIWATSVEVAFQPLVKACRGDALDATPRRRADCRHVARLLSEESDTLLARGIGMNMRLRTYANEDELRAAAIAYRRFHWQSQQWNALQQRDPVDAAHNFAHMLTSDRDITEYEIMQRTLTDAGVSMEPPAGWAAPQGY